MNRDRWIGVHRIKAPLIEAMDFILKLRLSEIRVNFLLTSNDGIA